MRKKLTFFFFVDIIKPISKKNKEGREMKKVVFMISFVTFVQASGSNDPLISLYTQCNQFIDFVNECNNDFARKIHTLFKKVYAITQRIDNIDEKSDTQSKTIETQRNLINTLQNRVNILENALVELKRK